jgi:hypothetical protein
MKSLYLSPTSHLVFKCPSRHPHHADLALALLSTFVEVQALALVTSRPSVPSVHPALDGLYEPVACDHFG